jgi:Flp pilus assembly protein TadG
MSKNWKIGVPLRRLGNSETGTAAVEFAIVAPVLLMLVFAAIFYSIYFTAYLGVRQAAIEGARAAVAGMSTAERSQLAIARATTIMNSYGSLMGASSNATITAAQQGTGLLKVSVSYDISSSPIMGYGSFLPLPSPTIQSDVIVANGSY